MALFVPAPRAGPREANFSGRPATTFGTTLTASATPHALPASPTEVVASTAADAELVEVTLHGMSTVGAETDGLVNVYVGAGGSEVVLLPNLLAGWTLIFTGAGTQRSYRFPVRIPRGTRLSADLRAEIASDTVQIMVTLYHLGGMHWSGAGVEVLGANTAASRGTDVTPGTTSEGTLTSIGTSGRAYRYVLPAVMGNADETLTASVLSCDIGTASAPIAGLEEFMCFASTAEWQGSVDNGQGRFVDIASGTALYARLQSSAADAEAKSVCIYGVY